MGIEFVIVAVWITFWLATAVSHLRHHKEDHNVLDTWERWYIGTMCQLAGPDERKRLARVRARKLYLKNHPVIENSPTTSKPGSTWSYPKGKPMILPEGATYTPRWSSDEYCEVCFEKTIFKYNYFGDIVQICIPCQNRMRLDNDGAVRKVTTQHRAQGIISINEQRELEESSEDRVMRYLQGNVMSSMGIPPTGFRTGIDYDDIVSPGPQVSYFRPSPALAEKPDEILSEVQVRQRRHQVWKRMKDLCDEMETEGWFDGELRAEWDACETKMRQYDVILDSMEHVVRHDERKCACGGSLNDANVCQRA